MAATYQYLPVSIRDIFADIVSDVSDNLASEDSLDIAQVSFKCETWIELIARLEAEDNSETHRSTKYPLVALIRNFDEKYTEDSILVEVSLTLVIVTPSEPQKLSEDRELENYIPILRPIYAELMEVIKSDYRFNGYYAKYPPHTRTESYKLGTDSPQGNKAYLLPDCVDAIIVSDLQLFIRPDSCLPTVIGNNTAVTYLNNVNELTVTYTDSSFIVEFEAALYLDTLNAAPQAASYTIYTQHNAQTQDATIGQSYSYNSFSEDMSGLYHGYIACNDGLTISKLYFFYRILSLRVRGCSEISTFTLQGFTTTGEQYTNYPFEVVTRWKSGPAALIRSQAISIDGGNSIWEEVYQPTTRDTQQQTNVITQPLSLTIRDVTNEVSIDGLLTLNNISYYKQQ